MIVLLLCPSVNLIFCNLMIVLLHIFISVVLSHVTILTPT